MFTPAFKLAWLTATGLISGGQRSVYRDLLRMIIINRFLYEL